MKLTDHLSTNSGWEVTETDFIADQIVTTGSNFLIGNGYLGYRGTFAEWRADQYTACIVTDTYDQADGNWKELCNVPNGLYTSFQIDGQGLPLFPEGNHPYQRTLSLKDGFLSRTQDFSTISGMNISLNTEKFASLHHIHLLAMKYSLQLPAEDGQGQLELTTGIDNQVWSLQGNHFQQVISEQKGNYLLTTAQTIDDDIKIIILEGILITNAEPDHHTVHKTQDGIFRELSFDLESYQDIALEKFVVIYTSNDVPEPLDSSLKLMDDAISSGYQTCKEAHIQEWQQIWSQSDIEIEGNLEDQTLTRFNLYHNIIATPTHAHLPIGARGLSTQVYQGAAFWDQEIFNLPMFIYTQPEIARNILEYRYFTLDGARSKAKRLGYRGAFYAWTSGKTGEELFPDFFFTDVLTGRKIRNHFNDWQIHISPDIVYAVWKYYLASGDQEFLFSHGAEILFEVARFLYSYSFFKAEKNRFEFIRLLGPDEYHENVDNNAFTNYQAHYTLEKSIQLYDQIREQKPDILKELSAKLHLTEQEISGWQRMKELLYLPEPDPKSRLIEQFDGYFDLEDIFPDQARERLIDPDEYWGWPNGVAVHTQVLKQADVIQLMALHDLFPPAIIRANYEYYEPRTEHGSSLSPSVHSLVASKANHPQQAYRYFKESATIDLYHSSKKIFSGGSFLGGIHTAACGAAWIMIVMGFAGFKQHEDKCLKFDPRIPAQWDSIRFQLIIHGHQMCILVTSKNINIESLSADNEPITIEVRGNQDTLEPGKSVGFDLV